jgi:hypothetical protein
VSFTTSTVAGQSYIVTATDNTTLTGVSASMTTTAGPATSYVITLGSATPAAGANVTVTAQLSDANGNPVATSGRTVTWTKTGSGGAFSAATSTTSSSGIATVIFTTAANGGTAYTITATDNTGFVGTSPTMTTASAAHYLVTSSSSSPVAGDVVTIAAQLVDGTNAALATGGKIVTWTASGTGGSFASATSTTNASGIATVVFTTSAGPTYAVTATDNASATGTSSAITVTAGTPTSISVTGNRTIIINAGATVTPAFQVLNQFTVPIAGAAMTFVNRSAAATVSTAGLVTGAALGQSIVVATSATVTTVSDSVLVGVASPTGPVVRTDLSTFRVAKGSTVVVTLIADMRASGEKLGALTTQLVWDPMVLTYQSDAETASNVGAQLNVTGAASGSLTVTMASSAGFSGATPIRTITFTVTATAGLNTLFSIIPTELVGATTFTDLLPVTLAIRVPVISK